MPPYRKSGSTVHKICSNILIPSPGPNPITGGLLQGQNVLQWGPREVRWVMMSWGKCCLPWLLRAVGIWGQRLEKEAKTHPLCYAEFWASPFQAKLERLKICCDVRWRDEQRGEYRKLSYTELDHLAQYWLHCLAVGTDPHHTFKRHASSANWEPLHYGLSHRAEEKEAGCQSGLKY